MGGQQLLRYVRNDPGQAPVAYLAQAFVFRCFGYSLFAARLVSVASSILSCLAMALLGKLVGFKQWILPGVIFAIVPLQLRYAIEARPYELALLFSIIATMLILKSIGGFSPVSVCCYALVICLGSLTQPYFVFVPATHLLWAALTKGLWHPFTKRLGIAVAVMVFCYLPWYLATKSVLTSPDMKADIGLKTPLTVFKEMMGGGTSPRSLFSLA